MTRCTFTGVFGIVLTTLWTASVTKEMAEVKSAKTTPAMIDTQSLAPYLAVVVVKMWMTEWMVCHCILLIKNKLRVGVNLLPSPASLWSTSV